jgi:hypothetical protein
LRKVLESFKRGEKSSTVVRSQFINENDQEFVKALGEKYDSSKDVTFDVELKGLVKVEDWFKDGGSALKRTLRKGKGSSPNIDSTIKGIFSRMLIIYSVFEDLSERYLTLE